MAQIVDLPSQSVEHQTPIRGSEIEMESQIFNVTLNNSMPFHFTDPLHVGLLLHMDHERSDGVFHLSCHVYCRFQYLNVCLPIPNTPTPTGIHRLEFRDVLSPFSIRTLNISLDVAITVCADRLAS
jgi:hypothetical protein